ncbi:hypothetical protein CERSUDRAFT_88801 [Gelatoporia subvermispora B]|uniref:Uncharacterized protein n=1 Tax=Ceriporiopsis subvermispora (strain B) TaxID=914234 RepID=M2R091_CERS8|nr:hypothetical protein CERSUDRAFT_88801 [Gelatoporia subvermispora B]
MPSPYLPHAPIDSILQLSRYRGAHPSNGKGLKPRTTRRPPYCWVQQARRASESGDREERGRGPAGSRCRRPGPEVPRRSSYGQPAASNSALDIPEEENCEEAARLNTVSFRFQPIPPIYADQLFD